jgi:hypothetical protein
MDRNRKKIPTSQESNSTLWQKITRFRDACWELNYHSIEPHGAWSKEHSAKKITPVKWASPQLNKLRPGEIFFDFTG